MSEAADHGFDTIALDLDTGHCVLGLLAYAPWTSEQLYALQERINRCLQSIESGSIYLDHPGARDRDFALDIRAIHAPNKDVQAFLASAAVMLEEAGYVLRVGPLGSAYAMED